MCAQSTGGGAGCLVVRECVCTQARARAFQAEGPVLHPLPWPVAYSCKKVKAEGWGEVQKRLTRPEVRPGSPGLRFCRPAAGCSG